MYLPEQFEETDHARIASIVANHPFGMLVTVTKSEPFVSHIPFLFDPESGKHGKLLGHLAKANPQWQHFGNEVLAVFQGPHAYVSPSWYASPGVPTWNYAVVHMKGKARLLEEKALQALLERMTKIHESGMENPWKPDLDEERRKRLLGMIAGFEIEITEVRAKFKLSQNRPDRQMIMRKLASSPGRMENEIAALMGLD
ncbi:MAG TPA: FMN-binding negative transcriptional regulator [Burkholderiales bacterium]|nr:FMN-binding negative transcriptional regulator [Burkholderiales bacterium]